MKLKVFRTKKGAKLPHRAHPTDAGLDLFFCSEGGESIVIPPNETTILPTGLKIGIPDNYMLEIKNKSGIASKKQLLVGACVVDAGYDGEVFVNLHNVSKDTKIIDHGQKIAQAILIPIEVPLIEEIQEDRVYERETSRGSGSLGSTGDF